MANRIRPWSEFGRGYDNVLRRFANRMGSGLVDRETRP